ncbi:hypothetical protein [Actinomadura sp. WMMA1423]|uniref:hypothetical protein n=1 Tax=Actinomadura sp. WMMA1423 TaxID=2591108 RepID=UPI00143D2BD9|nr:hypothetical protein [Actinomadura sp. WMMA1423]
MGEISVGRKVRFEFDPGKWRVGTVVEVVEQPGWDCPELYIRYRGSISPRRATSVTAV